MKHPTLAAMAALALYAPAALAADSTFALRGINQLQYDTPLNRVQILGAHNAWNDSSALWANQRLPLEQLLTGGVRNVDLDVHLDGGTVKLCHSKCGQIYSADDDYPAELRKIADWLRRNPKDVVLIDLEDRANDQAGVVGPLQQAFGSLLYLPADKPANRWETPREMVARGKRVIVKSANAVYDGRTVWDGRLFAYGADGGWNSRQVKYADPNACTLNGQAIVPGGQFYTVSDSKLAKEVLPDAWVDETGTIDAGNIPGLLACGINIVDADRWDDGLFRAAVWNWADGEPNNAGNAEHCAQARGDGRWNDLGCGAGLRYACRSDANADDWRVTVARGAWQDGAARCAAEFPGFRFAVPATPWQNRKLRAALGGGEAWLAYSDQAREGEWQDYAYRATEWHADAVPQRYGSLQLPGATAVKVKVQGSVTLAADGLRIYDGTRTLRATVGGYVGLREFTVEDGGVIVEYLGAGVAAPNYLTVSIEPAAAAPQPPVWRKLANGKGKCLDLEDRATGNGTRIHHWSCHGADSQLWWHDEQGRLHPKAAPNKCADASGAGTAKGTPIVLWDCNGGANQRWLRGANASFRVSNAPDKALDIKDSAWGAIDGQDAHLWDAHGGWSQQWNWQ